MVRVHTKETKEKIRQSLLKTYSLKPKGEHSKLIGSKTKGKYNKELNSIYTCSGRTRTKIIERLNLGCSLCGWNKSTCDLHHIEGRKIDNPHNHNNLTLLCPNCHRLIHTGKINKDVLIPISLYFPDNWSDFYFG